MAKITPTPQGKIKPQKIPSTQGDSVFDKTLV
jgi:hypothetical protein